MKKQNRKLNLRRETVLNLESATGGDGVPVTSVCTANTCAIICQTITVFTCAPDCRLRIP